MRNRISVLRVLICAAVLLVLAAGTGCGPGAPEENRKIKIGVSVYDQYDTFISKLKNRFQEDAP